MSDAINRFRERKEGRIQGIVDEIDGNDIDVGALSDDLAKYLPLATGAATEVAVDAQKKKEAADAAKAAAGSEGAKATAAAQLARKNAAMAQADAITETDPAGPKHKLAVQLDLEARAAEAKAGFFGGAPSAGGAMSPMAMAAFGPQGKKSNTMTYALVGAGVVAAGLITILLVKRKR